MGTFGELGTHWPIEDDDEDDDEHEHEHGASLAR
jgi:hypothetical protein